MVPLSSPYLETTARWLPIPHEAIDAAVTSPDQTGIIQLPGDPAGEGPRLYLKAREGKARPEHLLVLVDRGEVSDAWPIAEWMIGEQVTPLDALRAVSNRCGLRIRVGRSTGRLILSESIPAPPFPAGAAIPLQEVSKHIVLLERLPSAEVKQRMWFVYRPEGRIDVSLAHVLVAKRLRTELPRP